MTTQRDVHPSADVLKAFGLGKLDDNSAGVVINHLDRCAECRQEVAALSGDDFLNRLRQAHEHGATPAPAKALAGAARAPKPPGSQTPIPNMPSELANNPQYEILRELGRGGMGVVYLAKNKLMDRLEVLKVVNKTLLDHAGAVERFLREIRSAAKLSHANVVGAYSAVQQGELLAFAMEYVEGEDLGSLVKSQGPLPIAHACFYAQQAALGLQHAFEKQMVHRDIKPQNLILAREGKKHIVKVLDFGLAKVIREKSEDTGLTGEGKMLGTPDYIAPEQTLDAAKADIRADIYSLGCTLYFLLSGRPPFSASSLGAILVAHQMQEAKPLNLARPEVPVELAAVVRKMMAKSPAKRYQTPLEVVQALSPFVKQGTRPKSSPELSMGTAKEPVVVKAVKSERPPAPVAPVNPPPRVSEAAPAVAWEALTEGGIASAPLRRSEVVRTRRLPVRKPWLQQKWLLGGGIGVGVLLLALLGMWASGVFQVKTKDGILTIKVNEPNPDVFVDGEKVTVSWDKGGKQAEIRVKPGTRKVEVKKDGFSVDGKELTLKDGDREIFTALLLPEKVVAKADPPPEPEPKKTETEKPVIPPSQPDADFVPLFNGKDLTGWKAHPTQPGNWRVKNGILVGCGSADSYLYTNRADYKDFHLKVEARINDGGNSGVCFRTPFGPQLPENNPQFLRGYEAQINSTHTDIFKTGSLYAIPGGVLVNVRESLVPPGDWFTLEVIAEGNHIIIKVNGKTTVAYTDEKQRFISGHLAVQQYTPRTVAEFRRIEIKELLPTVPTTELPKREVKEKNSFFNEEDLTGWDGLPGYWQAKDGCIVGEPPPGQKAHTFLCSKKHYRDFDLKFRVKREGSVGNSGVQFRSHIVDMARFAVVGPQCEIDAFTYTLPPGSLVTEPNGDPLKVKPSAAALTALAKVYTDDGFNDFHIRCVGKHVTIKVNDVTTVDGDFPSLPEEGIIAWQLHGSRTPQSVMFRIVEFTDLSAPASTDGFVPLFNGKDLTGWSVDGGIAEQWTVEGDAIVGRSHDFTTRNYLLTDKEYANFVLRFDFKVEDGNHGVAIRAIKGEKMPLAGNRIFDHPLIKLMNPAIPVMAAKELTGTTHWLKSAGAYVKPSAVLSLPRDTWLSMEVVVRGDNCTATIDNKPLVDVTLDRNARNKESFIPGLQRVKGKVGFQTNTGTVRFRKIEIKELPAAKSETPAAAKAASEEKGFVPLFNGKDLKGWKVHPRQRGNWRVEKGVLIGSGPAISHLYSSRGNYKNFHLRVEARINVGGNSGIHFRAGFGPAFPVKNPAYPLGYEAQIFNSKPGDPSQTGSLYAGAGAAVVSLRESPVRSGEWFTEEVIAQGTHIVIKVNGKTTADYTDDKRLYTSGHIALQQLDAATVVEFRRIEIKERK